jgi:hypothetical protein
MAVSDRARAKALSLELATLIMPGFEAVVFKASRGIEDTYELTKIPKDGSRFPAVVSVTALRDDLGKIVGWSSSRSAARLPRFICQGLTLARLATRGRRGQAGHSPFISN